MSATPFTWRQSLPFHRNAFVFTGHQAIGIRFKAGLHTKERKLHLQSVEIGLFDDGIDAHAAKDQALAITINADIEDAPYPRSYRFSPHLTKSFTRNDHWHLGTRTIGRRLA